MSRFLLQFCACCGLLSPALVFADWGKLPVLTELSHYSKVSLGFASQDIKSPISIFGHTFLVFHHQEIPEADALIVEFTGDAPDFLAGVSALISSVPGRYSLSYLSEKRRQYDGENRSLWLYGLKFDERELQRLIEYFLQSKNIQYPYDFSQKNCAFYVAIALANAKAGLEFKQDGLFVTPVSTLRWARSENMVFSAAFLPSTQLRAIAEYDALPKPQREMVVAYLQRATIPLPQDLPRSVGDTVSAVAEHLLPREGNENSRNYLYSAKRAFPGHLKPIDLPTNEPSLEHGSASVSILLLTQANAAIISLSPGFVSLENEVRTGQRNAIVQVLKTDMLVENSGIVRLDQFHLLTIESNQAAEYLREGFTQSLDASYIDYRRYLGKKYAENKISFGRGASYIFGEHVFSVLPLGALIFSGNENGDAANGLLEIRVNLYKRLNEKFAYTAQVTQSLLQNTEIKQTQNFDFMWAARRNWGITLNLHRVRSKQTDSMLTGFRLNWSF